MSIYRNTLVTIAAIAGLPGAASAAMPSPVGNWVFEDGGSAVELYRCGPALCGRFSWFKPNQSGKGGAIIDRKNPDPAKQKRPLCGLEFITGLVSAADGSWTGGKLYSPGSGGFFDVDLIKVEPNRIVQRGYKGIRLLGKSFTLTRAPADLPRCKA